MKSAAWISVAAVALFLSAFSGQSEAAYCGADSYNCCPTETCGNWGRFGVARKRCCPQFKTVKDVVWKTEEYCCPVTVYDTKCVQKKVPCTRTVYKTCYRKEHYTVCKPVYKTCYKTECQIVKRPVHRTCYRTEVCKVRKPIAKVSTKKPRQKPGPAHLNDVSLEMPIVPRVISPMLEHGVTSP